jgi:hypothetical protein
VPFRLDDHEVHVHRDAGRAVNRPDGPGPHRNFGDEAAVHHVDVDESRPALRGRAGLLAQAPEVGGQDRSRDPDAPARPAQGRISWINLLSMYT